MDIPRKDAARKRLIHRILIGVVAVVAISATTIGLSRLKPAAPGTGPRDGKRLRGYETVRS